jgi:hypothetical protein
MTTCVGPDSEYRIRVADLGVEASIEFSIESADDDRPVFGPVTVSIADARRLADLLGRVAAAVEVEQVA